MIWEYGTPLVPGWYPVLLCWEIEEGVFPSSAKWDGKQWSLSAVVAFGILCTTAEEAMFIARENDVDV